MRLVVLSDPAAREEIYLRNVVAPLEDALAALPNSTLVAMPSRLPGRPGRPSWLSAIRVVRRADFVFWIQFHLHPALRVWALAYTHPLAARAMLAIEQWEPRIEYLPRIVDAQRMCVCFVFYRQAWLELRRRYPDLPFERLRLGFDSLLFRDRGVERDIDVFWMGRRYEPLHRALEDISRKRGLVYRYSTSASDPATKDELASLMARSRYFVVMPPNFEDAERTGAFNPITSRYLEGAGAGCRLLGVLPNATEFREFFDPDAVVVCKPDGSDLADMLAAAEADPAQEPSRTATRDRAQREHTWERRAEEIHDRLLTLLEEQRT